MSSTYYITSHCIISNRTVYLNGKVVFRLPDADLAAFLLAVYHHFQLSYPKFYKMDNLSKLGWLTAELLLQGRPLNERYAAEKTGLVLSNASSSLDADLRYLNTMPEAASPALFVYTLPNIVIGEISIRHQFKGENAFYITERFEADMIYNQVQLLLDNQLLQACVCGRVEVLKQDYQSGLFLIEPAPGGSTVPFSAHQLNDIMMNAYE